MTNLVVGDIRTITAGFFDGPPDAAGNPTGGSVKTPATVQWSSSNAAVLSVASTGQLTGQLKALSVPAQVPFPVVVTITGAVPAAADALTSYSAFSGSLPIGVNPKVVTVTIFSASYTISAN